MIFIYIGTCLVVSQGKALICRVKCIILLNTSISASSNNWSFQQEFLALFMLFKMAYPIFIMSFQVQSRHRIVATIIVRQIIMKTKICRNKFIKTNKTKRQKLNSQKGYLN